MALTEENMTRYRRSILLIKFNNITFLCLFSYQALKMVKLVFQVYDDNDDYSEEDESDPEKTVVRPKFGFDILSLFVPVSSYVEKYLKICKT